MPGRNVFTEQIEQINETQKKNVNLLNVQDTVVK